MNNVEIHKITQNSDGATPFDAVPEMEVEIPDIFDEGQEARVCTQNSI